MRKMWKNFDGGGCEDKYKRSFGEFCFFGREKQSNKYASCVWQLKEETQIQTAKDYETAAVDVLALSFDMRITIIRDTKREKKIDFFTS